MRKFIQLAEDVEADLKELDNDADDLDRRRRDGKERAKAVVNTHHRLQDRIDEGILALEKVADSAGLARPNTRTAAELAAIDAEEKAAIDRLKTEAETSEVGQKFMNEQIELAKAEAPKLGEASGDTPATFQKAAE